MFPFELKGGITEKLMSLAKTLNCLKMEFLFNLCFAGL